MNRDFIASVRWCDDDPACNLAYGDSQRPILVLGEITKGRHAGYKIVCFTSDLMRIARESKTCPPRFPLGKDGGPEYGWMICPAHSEQVEPNIVFGGLFYVGE